MKIVFIILGIFTHNIIDFEKTKLACPWILGILIVFQFFPFVADMYDLKKPSGS
jgi:hypothetical protein